MTSVLPAFHFNIQHPTLRLGIVSAQKVSYGPTPVDLDQEMQLAEQAVRLDASVFPEAVRAIVRECLRVGGYKPTGRGKPASEFLLGMARDHGLPRVNNLVDINNLVSLMMALPISIFDSDKLGNDPMVRFGKADENYVFNASGQIMDVAGIPLVCSSPGDRAVGNAVKDSMIAKVSSKTQRITAVVYGSTRLPENHLEVTCETLVKKLQRFADAREICWHALPS